MDKKENINYMYSSDYVTTEEFCNQLHIAFKELFICDVNRDKNNFVIKFEDGGKFKVSVSDCSDE